jgi:1,4-alpha-glucan branching enzyme
MECNACARGQWPDSCGKNVAAERVTEETGMLRKRRITKDNVVKVTFDLPADAAHDSVRVVGEFNGWEGTPLERQKDGTWRKTVDLDPDREYQFRYLVDGERWVNDPAADDHVRNPYGEDNSVIKT